MGCAIFPRKYNNRGELGLAELKVNGVGLAGSVCGDCERGALTMLASIFHVVSALVCS